MGSLLASSSLSTFFVWLLLARFILLRAANGFASRPPPSLRAAGLGAAAAFQFSPQRPPRIPFGAKTTSQSSTATRQFSSTNDDDGFEYEDYNGAYRAGVAETTANPKHVIHVSASITLPFSAEVAYDAFSDLPRQPSWSPWLNSVEYIDEPTGDPNQLRETKWTMRFRGVKLSWVAISRRNDRPSVIEWESTRGIKNKGRVDFVPRADDNTLMNLSMQFQAPRVVAALFRRSDAIKTALENRILKTTLENFRDVVLENDLGTGIEQSLAEGDS